MKGPKEDMRLLCRNDDALNNQPIKKMSQLNGIV